ncbi:hypothetical protein GTY87_32425 [Streptomyces sp. SID7813]|uniref:Uncharacterized protein n=1 Tax=Streptomyces coelicolor (strain ATCC BAA-471 / A3(2) / M145) TaxID=100226 RepID=O86612_STRCO|nr:hypothetical protein [Streptomyces sp. SID7813]QFI46154.1 hypothetical protein FQ762_32755 [Streptomyces coelicolor A3(2)]THA93254.1 hypothetical protein E6R61_16155 [Streptomyces sp. LRa12]CAA20074.1 hypothetical protein SC3A7.11 [Streptomyces coelicolor A3(2)]
MTERCVSAALVMFVSIRCSGRRDMNARGTYVGCSRRSLLADE